MLFGIIPWRSGHSHRPLNALSRTSVANIHSQTGSSHTAGGQHHVHREKIGDHRGHGGAQHTGSQNSSAVPRITAGRPQQIPSSRGDFDGNDAA
jgi:hypothetical protein